MRFSPLRWLSSYSNYSFKREIELKIKGIYLLDLLRKELNKKGFIRKGICGAAFYWLFMCMSFSVCAFKICNFFPLFQARKLIPEINFLLMSPTSVSIKQKYIVCTPCCYCCGLQTQTCRRACSYGLAMTRREI